MTKIKVTFVLDVDDEMDSHDALTYHVKNTLEGCQGWQIFGEDRPFNNSVIEDVSAVIIEDPQTPENLHSDYQKLYDEFYKGD